jgi:hypothetical protein
MMSNQISWDAAVRALETSQPDAERRRRLLSVGWWLLVAAFACGFGMLLYMSVQDLADAWRTGDPLQWHFFWQGALDLLRMSPLAILSRIHGLWALTRPQQDVLAIRQQVAEGNDERAPIVADQPLVLPDNVFSHEYEIGPLSRPRSGRREAATTGATILIVVSVILALFSVIPLLIPGSDTVGRIISLVFVTITFALALGAARAHRIARALGQDIHVLADEHGLRWRRLAARNRFREIPWSQARAFVTLRFQRPIDLSPCHVFVLESPGAVLAWEITDRSTADQRAAHERLSRLIAARTHLPLRGLTSPVEAALSPEKQEEPKPALTFPLAPPGSNPVQAVELPITIVERNDPAARAARRSVRLGFLLTTVFTLPVLVLYGAGWGLQQYQPQYYSGLVARVHAEKPLYHDALSQDDGQWLVQEPSALNDYEHYFYTGGAYHLIGTHSDWFMFAYSAYSYVSDAAVEVTVSAAHQTNDDGLGLMLHTEGSSSNDFEVFEIDTHGNWTLWRHHYVNGTSNHDWTWIAGDYTQAAHQGAGARNRLLVIQRGSQFLLYVNEHFVGSYSDPATPRYGCMGIYVDMSTTEGIFSDFTVYPAPSTSLLPV